MLARLFMSLSLLAGAAVLCQPAVAREIPVDETLMKAINPDGDGTVDLAEAKKAGAALFKKLDKDHDGTLDLKEVEGHLTKAEFDAANPDGDKTLELDEYMALIEKRFNAANPDDDGTLDMAELKSPKGQALLTLIY